MKPGSGGIAAIILVPVMIISMLFAIVLLAATSCGSDDSITVDPASVPQITVAGYGPEQLVNAAYVLQAGKALGLDSRDQTIGVMTAMAESSLRTLDYGDEAGPDSRGLFQQRDNWGPLADRMDPFKSSTMFFNALAGIPEAERKGLSPTQVAHRVQRNADPNHYTAFWDAAVQVVEKLGDTKLSSGASCEAGEDGAVGKKGWAKPGNGPINSEYGYRPGSIIENHSGTDFEAGGCDGPIWAANSGRVSNIFVDSYDNWILEVDHGKGLVTRYVHMWQSGILVTVGQKVKAGQQIAKVGSSGASTGCHLHFEVLVEGKFLDPIPFLAERAITY